MSVTTKAHSRYVQFHNERLDRDATRMFPADKVVGVVGRLAAKVQSGIKPSITWEVTDLPMRYLATFQWQSHNSQLALQLCALRRGVQAFLFDHFQSFSGPRPLVSWNVERYGDTILGEQVELDVCRMERIGSRDMVVTNLKSDDPVFAGIPLLRLRLRQPAGELPELGDDIIAVTQQWLQAAGIA